MARKKYPVEDENLFIEYCTNRNIAKSTIESYKRSLQKYSDFTGKTLEQLIDEAIEEEENGLRMAKRSIKRYLIDFNNSLYQQDRTDKGIAKIMATVRSFYGEFDIQLPKNNRKIRRDKKVETINDLPTLEDIQKFLEHARNPLKPIVILGMSSGMGKAEICTLTFEDLYKSIKLKYYPESLPDIIRILEANKNSVPYWEVKRVKNGNEYFTFSTPESLDYIRKYLEDLNVKQTEYKPNKDDKLFRNINSNKPITANGLSSLYDRNSIRAGLKKEDGKSIVRPHLLRKFFATTLNKNKIPFLTNKWLMGHTIDSTNSAYFKADPEAVKEEYIGVIEQLVTNQVEIKLINNYESVTQKIEDLENEVIYLRSKIKPRELTAKGFNPNVKF